MQTLEYLKALIPQTMRSDQLCFLRQLKKLSATDKQACFSLQQAIEASYQRRQQRLVHLPQPHFDDLLPVCQQRAAIAEAIKAHPVVIIAGDTGSGKTTQIPKICLSLGRGVAGLIGHTQPRRVAARSVASRIAEELQSPLGDLVGYQVRFHEQVKSASYIKLMTDGILLAELQRDKMLSQYDTLIIDEAHERSLNIDFLLGFLKQLLPKRPDLKLIITSATFNPQQFAHYFNHAPIIEVTGRTYPVSIRYQPTVDENSENPQQHLVAAVHSLVREGPGDILIFLSGEREIRETAEALRQSKLSAIDILPLYARLNAQEQHKVFEAHSKRRIILATNVAETSLTVPGIQFVIDTGFARIKRYSHRSKIQRLPIEPIAQANAKQRAGRCGRTQAGICIRLYSEADYQNRPEFTEPEILRSNLASVILQMIALGLSPIEHFPFLDKPDSRMVRAGYKLLQILQAIDERHQLTPLGRQLAKLPLDPRLGSMLVAAHQQRALTEVLIIASALSIQDPRERPLEWQQAADAKHQLFADEQSDFLSYLKLWQAFHEQQQHLSNKRLRAYCQSHFLAYRRCLEWQDIHSQLLTACHSLGLKLNDLAADYAAIHRSLLYGLIDYLGMRQTGIDYLGARQLKFRIFPGSQLVKKPPTWLMAAEITETQRIYARTIARIEPEWLEQVAPQLIKKHYYEPHWSKRRAQVVAYGKTSLYGLTINPQFTVNYGPIDPVLARAIFIRSALVAGDYQTDAAFFKHNQQLLAELQTLEDKTRRKDIIVDEQTLFEFYDAILPADCYEGIRFERWRKQIEVKQPRLLFFTPEQLIKNQPILADEDFPECIDIAGNRFQLSYRFEPGHPDDGVTIQVPLPLLAQLPQQALGWLVPGLLQAKVQSLLKTLPKTWRRYFTPVANYADACLQRLQFDRDTDLLAQLTQILQQLTGIHIPADAWNLSALEPHLHFNIQVLEKLHCLATGRDLEALRQQLAPASEQSFAALTEIPLERTGITHWDFGDLPAQLEINQASGIVLAYPALVDELSHVAIKLCSHLDEAKQLTYGGLRRLFYLANGQPLNYLRKQLLPKMTPIVMKLPELGNKEHLLTDVLQAAIQMTFMPSGIIALQQQLFEDILRTQSDKLIGHANQLITWLQMIAEILFNTRKALSQLEPKFIQIIEQQIPRLVYPGFLTATPPAYLGRLVSYAKAIQLRVEKYPRQAQKDVNFQQELNQLWQAYQQQLQQTPFPSQRLLTFRWLLEEYQLSLFAQELKTAIPISKQRLAKEWAQLSSST